MLDDCRSGRKSMASLMENYQLATIKSLNSKNSEKLFLNKRGKENTKKATILDIYNAFHSVEG